MRLIFANRSWRVTAIALVAVLSVIAMPLVANTAAQATNNTAEITIKKVVEGEGADLDKEFSFDANFQQLDDKGKGTGNPTFQLSDDTEQTFTISTDQTGKKGVSEKSSSDKNYSLDRVVCESKKGSVVDTETGNKDANLEQIFAGDEILCTFYNKYTGPAPEATTTPTPNPEETTTPVEGQPRGGDNKYRMTLVARVCDDFKNIYANRSRNNIQETLRNLGPDSQYNSSMNPPVQPSKEDALDPQKSHCEALNGWTFALGTTYTGGNPQNLSKLTSQYSPGGTATTLSSVQERNVTNGATTGGTVKGAVTIELTNEQIKDATAGNNKFWIQGGTPSAQLNGRTDLSFGALRCSVDALNGDNVEWAHYGSGVKHQYCYAFYVKEKPKPATIQITKKVEGAPAGTHNFGFTGNVSYNPGGAFTLSPTGSNGSKSESFIRDAVSTGGTPWTVSETPKNNWDLKSITCDTGGNDGIKYETDLTSGKLSIIELPEDSNVHCTYTNTYVPNHGKITLKKEVAGDGADQNLAFGFTGSGSANGETASLKDNGTKEFSLAPFSNGNWIMTENDLPADWSLADISCTSDNGSTVNRDKNARKITVTKLSENGTVNCTYKNSYTQPTADITVKKFVTGTNADQSKLFAFTSNVSGVSDFSLKHGGSKTFTVPTTQNGKYIAETAVGGKWSLANATCTDGKFDRDGNKVVLKDLQKGDKIECVFTNNYTPAAASLTINKSVTGINASPTVNFPFSGDAGDFTLNGGDNKSKTGFTLPINGSFTAFEDWANMPQGWTGATPQCSSEKGTDISYDGGRFSLSKIKEGDSITCDYVNSYHPAPVTVEVSKKVEGTNADADQLFPFTDTVTDGSYKLSQNSNAKKVTVPVNDTAWSVTEGDLPARWAFTNAVCSVDGTVINGVGGKTSTLSADQLKGLEGKTVKCVYTNTYTPENAQVVIVKDVKGINASTTQDFDFGGTGGDFTLNGGANNTKSFPLSNIGGDFDVNEVVDELPDGWAAGLTKCETTKGTKIEVGNGSFELSEIKEGDQVTCTFTNVYSPKDVTVNVLKKVEGINASTSQEFPFTASAGTDAFNLAQTSDAKTISVPVTANAWSVSEGDLPARWAFTNAVCSVGDEVINGARTTTLSPAKLAELEGETVECVYTNTYTPADVTVKVSKKVEGINASPSQEFPFTASAGTDAFNLAQSSTAKSIAVPVTTSDWTVTEGAMPSDRWAFTNAVCSVGGEVIVDAGNRTSMLTSQQLAALEGQTVDCVYTNTYSPEDVTVNVSKQVEGINADAGQEFPFADSTEHGFDLSQNSDAKTISVPVTDAAWSVSEGDMPSEQWAFKNAVCTVGEEGLDVVDGNVATLDATTLAALEGKEVDCVYTNSYTPVDVTVNITKHVEGAAASEESFKFGTNMNEAGSFDLADGQTETFKLKVVEGDVNFTAHEDVASLGTGWNFSNLQCSSSDEGTAVEANASNGQLAITSLSDGATVDCDYTNTFTPAPPTETSPGPTEPVVTPTEPNVTPTDGPVDPSNSDDSVVTPGGDDSGNQGDGVLAQTGAKLGLAVLIAMIALVTGGMMLLTARRRSRKH